MTRWETRDDGSGPAGHPGRATDPGERTRGAMGSSTAAGAEGTDDGRTTVPQTVLLDADLAVRRDAFTVEVALRLGAGQRIALLGPNGAGKSTVLGALAGVTALDRGTVVLDGRTLDGPGGTVRPSDRGITLLDQAPRLFPHLDLAGNIGFGPRAHGATRSAARGIAREWLERVGLADRAVARPHTLSGGQQQRVAIARAFAARPRLLLLDEPFAALDAQAIGPMRSLLLAELDRTGTAAILVTHDLADAWQWADGCLVLDRGRLVADCSPAELATRPRTPFTAALAGFGGVHGRWDAGASAVVVGTEWSPGAMGVEVGSSARGDAAGSSALAAAAPDRHVALLPAIHDPDQPLHDGAPVFAVAAPRDVDVVPPGTPGALPGQVTHVALDGGLARIHHTSGLIAEVPTPDAASLRTGTVWLCPRTLRAHPTSPG